MTVLLGACGHAGSPAADKSLYAHGLEMVSAMQEMASSEQYLAYYSDGIATDTRDMIASAGAGDFSAPRSVYKVSVLNSLYFTIDTDGLSDALAKQLESQMVSSLPQMINARGGTHMLAASSLCTFQKVFVSSEQVEKIIYLYTFEQAAPVAITFIAGEDNAVYAKGVFILYDGEKMDTVQAVEELFEACGFEVEVEEVAP